MKSFNRFFFVLALSVFALSCGEDDDPAPAGNSTGVTATVNGTNVAPPFNSSSTVSGMVFVVSSNLNTGESLTVSFEDTLSTGTYNLDFNVANAISVSYAPDSTKTYVPKKATFSLTVKDAANDSYEGTFSGTFVNSNAITTDSVMITDGKFKY